MNLKELFIKDEKEYLEIKEILSTTFQLQCELPDQVFQKGYGSFLFGEYNHLFKEEFWNSIQELSKVSGDSYVVLAELENCYNEKMGWYECVKIPVELTYEHYLDIFNMEESDNGKFGLVHYGFYFVFTSPSLQWGIWAERDIETYVFSCKENFKSKLAEIRLPGAFQLNEVTNHINSVYYDEEEAKRFCEKLLRNYKN
ncbi:hypothetical protein LH47_02842 [Anoxybacillus thermarum]|uniref:Uncharacterized protein n=1 Tax=Anoxybacillus thermarum TaxID=404937 RepID=A0A0D0QUC4_9BACL|nr:hypothetical protein [Anoxybacillus thermarum]KIQ93104.1 hypothetical protein LH47_02842 [Anoxybacillus thermarum]